MNPCPCGFLGHPSGRCRCTPEQVARYRGRISGPLLDRIDLHIEVPALPESELTQRGTGEDSAAIRSRVAAARERQIQRQGKPNARLQGKEIDLYCPLDEAAQNLLKQAISRLNLSARGYHRVLRVARTISDLAASDTISPAQVAEAIQYRRLAGVATG
jgi:magnesium chelatase family protein